MQFVFHCSFYNQVFYENDFQGKQQKNTNKDVLKNQSSVRCYFRLLSRTFLKIAVNKLGFSKITG